NLNLNELTKNRDKYYLEAERIKQKKKQPSIFGKFFLYKIVDEDQVILFKELSQKEKKIGSTNDIWINYYKGNKKGERWNISYQECINWSQKAVSELKEGVVTNSRWQGDKFYSTTGFGWVDY